MRSPQDVSVGQGERAAAEPRAPRRRRGWLHVFLGAAPAVGKTFAMLDDGLRLAEAGARVLVGVVETHGRPDLMSRVGALEVVLAREISYRGITLKEMDLDLLLRGLDVVLVDELAHTDAPGCRFEKRGRTSRRCSRQEST